MSEEAVHLSWNEFKTTAVKTFQSLRSDSHFTDVTLACCDGQQVLAHKVILSSCSTFFRDILVQNPHQHPLIYLKGVCIDDLKNVIKFIYSGEVEVDNDRISKFLEAGNELKIEGLRKQTAGKENTSIVENETVIPTKAKPSFNTDKKIKEEFVKDVSRQDDDDGNDSFEESDIIVERQNENHEHVTGTVKGEIKCGNCPKLFANRNTLSVHVRTIHENNVTSCQLCAYKSNSNLPRHMKKMHPDVGLSTNFPMVVTGNDEHDPISDLTCDQCMYEANSGHFLVKHRKLEHPDAEKYNCLVCNNQFASRTSLRVHQVIHSGTKFSCEICKHKSSTKSNLYRHVMKVHGNENK